MAQIDRFMIAPPDGGARTDLKPWLIPDNAFAQLNNAYVFRGRVRKRIGSRLMQGSAAPILGSETLVSRLRIGLGTSASGTIPTGYTPAVGQMFSIGTQVFTVHTTGTPVVMLNTGSGIGTFNTTTGAYSFNFSPASVVYFYPALPVMGIVSYISDILEYEPTFTFDTVSSYQYLSTGWERFGTTVWNGSNSNFFWGANWRGVFSSQTYLFVSNYNAGTTLNDSNVMYFWDGSSSDWTLFNPSFSKVTPTNTIVTALIIVPFKSRLVLLNIVENTGMSPGSNRFYTNKCRYSWIGDPTNAAAFYEDVPGSGGFLDAPTKEAIVSAQFLKDRLMVFFEQSTWELAYTGNQVTPFVWQQINTELGAQSTFSHIPFDKVILGIGNVGVHSCNGSNVDRIDQNIPDNIFSITQQNNGLKRVCGIRDYFLETTYWAYPDVNTTAPYSTVFPNKVLVYNYKNETWAFNDDSITALGDYQDNLQTGFTWADAQRQWSESNYVWRALELTYNFRSILAGNQEGFMFILDDGPSVNAPALQISNITSVGNVITIKCIDHNLQIGDFIQISDCVGMTSLNYNVSGKNYEVQTIIDKDMFTISPVTISGTYSGGGVIARVSQINILTKQYNFYLNEGRNSLINKVDCYVQKTSQGQITIDYYISSSNESILQGGKQTGALLGTGVLDTSPYPLIPLEQSQERLWHPVYIMADGECIQLNIYLTPEQLADPDISDADFELHAMLFYTSRSSSRLQ